MTSSDLVIEMLAASEAELRERVASLEADVGVYRELAQAALDALRQMTVFHQALQRTHRELREEYRAFLERLALSAQDDVDEEDAA